MSLIDLERVRVERLAKDIVCELRVEGTARARVAEVESVERWRAAARRAGRMLDWHVRTGVSSGWVYAASDDWQAPPGAHRLAARVVEQLIFDR